jgi:hypothetical protein
MSKLIKVQKNLAPPPPLRPRYLSLWRAKDLGRNLDCTVYNPDNMTRRRASIPSEELESVLSPVTSSAVRDQLAKNERLDVRLSAAEKREIQETARGFGLTTTDYVLRLHRLTVAIQATKRRGRAMKTPKS